AVEQGQRIDKNETAYPLTHQLGGPRAARVSQPVEPECDGVRSVLARKVPRRHTSAPRTECLAGLSGQPELRVAECGNGSASEGADRDLNVLPVKLGHPFCRVASAERAPRQQPVIQFRLMITRRCAMSAFGVSVG